VTTRPTTRSATTPTAVVPGELAEDRAWVSRRPLAWSLFALATGLVVAAALGPLVTGVIRYRLSATVVNQLIALDAVSLAVIAPLSVLAGRLLLLRHPAGPLLAAAPAGFTAYMITQTVLGTDYLGVDGDSERWFPLHLGLFVLSVGILVGAWRAACALRPPIASRRRDVWTAVALFVVAAFVGLVQWLPALADMMGGRPSRAGYLDNPAMTWTLALLDLGLATPLALAAGVALLRRGPLARQTAAAAAGFFALVGPAVAAMAITMWIRDDPNGTSVNVVMMCVVGAALALLGVAVYRPLLRPDRSRPPVLG
jgi:hypothetical protein